MGLRGPQPKPTVQRLLEGNPGHQTLNKFEPQPPKISSIPAPDWMNDEARRYWNRLIPMLANIGMLTEADLTTLERYCDFLSDWKFCRDFLAKAGNICYPIKETTEISDPNNPGKMIKVERVRYMQEFPHIAKKLKISEHLLRIEQHFGMTPAARTRIMAEPPPMTPGTIIPEAQEEDVFEVN